MSEKDHNLVTAKAGSVVAENLKLSLATPAGSLTPSTVTAMVGIHSGTALQIAPKVQEAMTKLSEKAASLDYPANVQAAAALSTLTSIQGKLLPSGNHAALGSFINQAKAHIDDAKELKLTTNFISSTNFGDYGSGISDMSSLADRGLTNMFGSLPGASAALASTGTMFNGIDPKKFGTPAGLVEALNNNKLGNATGLNNALAKAGINVSDLDNPAFAEKIPQVVASIKDPAALNAVKEQFNQNPFAGMPSYSGNDSSLYTNTAGGLLGGS